MTEKIYAGSFTTLKGKSFQIEFGAIRAFSRTFSEVKYGSVDMARVAAEAYRREVSDRQGLTVTRPSLVGFWEMIKDLGFLHTEDVSDEYVGGIMDGDGCISIDKRYQLQVCIGQSCNQESPLVIEYLNHRFGNRIDSHERININTRKVHRITLTGENARIILNCMRATCALKKDQAEIAMDFLDGRLSKSEAYAYLLQAKELKVYKTVEIDRSRLTLPYIAGLFDAEGCVQIAHTGLQINLAQKQSPRILYALAEMFPGGRVGDHEGKVTWCAEGATRFLKSIEPFLVHKRSQVLCALKAREFVVVHPRKRTIEDKRHLKSLLDYVKAQKHI
jgi:hypothetical protein